MSLNNIGRESTAKLERGKGSFAKTWRCADREEVGRVRVHAEVEVFGLERASEAGPKG